MPLVHLLVETAQNQTLVDNRVKYSLHVIEELL